MTEPTASGPTVHRTGIVFVHGIGTQPPRETFLNWAEPIVRALSTLRQEMDAVAGTTPVGEDPVRRAGVDGDRSWAEIEIPAAAGRAVDTWLITESYWASEVRAPGLVLTLRYLRRHLPAMIRGVAAGYGQREARRRERMNALIAEAETGPGGVDAATASLVSELRSSMSTRWAWIDGLDQVWQYQPVRWTLSSIAIVAAVAALAVYAPLRALPIKAIRDRAELAALNTWLVDWCGDIPVLLDDRVQAALVRSRLEASVSWLKDRGCDAVVVVAHSGGAIVSYSTLLRLTQAELPVTKLITHGQGLALAWRLLRVRGGLPVGHPLRGDLGAAHPAMRWVDFWASYDPAPAGPLVGIEGCPLVVEPSPGAPAGSPIHVESRPVTNLMHLGLDHGAYWDNDEGFLVPLIRHLDDPAGDGSGSRFYRGSLARAARIERRRRRVGFLLGWRWLSFAAGLLAVLFTASAPGGLAAAGNALAWAWSFVPGGDWVSGPIAAVGSIVAIALELLRLPELGRRLAEAGPVVLGAAIPILGAVLIYRRGVGSWQRSDEKERAKVRRERLGPVGEAWARSEGILLVGGLVALAAAALLGPRVSATEGLLAVAAILVVTAILGLGARMAR